MRLNKMAKAVFVPLSVAMLATCMDDLIEMVAADEAPEGANVQEGPQGGLYYISEKGKKIYVDSIKPSIEKAAKGIKDALTKCKDGVKAFKESGCAEKCKKALGAAKDFAKMVLPTIKYAYNRGMTRYHATSKKGDSNKIPEYTFKARDNMDEIRKITNKNHGNLATKLVDNVLEIGRKGKYFDK